MMRLLNVHSLELETFDHRTAPPYVILSHTWGNDEVDYQVFTSRPESRTGSGWVKILGTCKQAIKDKYDWVWIDTCNMAMAFPGPSLVAIARYRSTDGPPPLYEILEANLKEASNSRDCHWIPEIANDIAVKVDADIEYGGIVYKFDVHFEPIKGQADRLVRWEEEGEELKVFADYSIMLATPEERDPKLESLIEEGVIIRE